MKHKLIKIQILEDYKLKLWYNNQEVRIFNFAPHLNLGRYIELQDLKLFNTAKIVSNTIEWDTEIDIDPLTLYNKSEFMDYNNENLPKNKYIQYEV